MRVLSGTVLLILAAANSGSTQTPAPHPYDGAFWKIWSDGQAELSSYDLTEPHYGSPRRGVAIAIFVTETFSNSARVKADSGKHPHSDEFPVMKLNLVKDFQTGIYDYNDLTSAFLALSAVNGRVAGTLTKVAFSSQEWCGTVFHQLLFDPRSIRSTRHSYFDGEGDAQGVIPYPADGIATDALWFWARGMAEPRLEPGESKTMQLLSSLQSVRDTHRAASWTQATFSRAAAPEVITVPAGRFAAQLWTVTTAEGKTRFWVSRNTPHWVLRWEAANGEKGALLATERAKYWQMNGPGRESELKKLKLAPRAPRTT